jgi:SAM-dependent methyltransferase
VLESNIQAVLARLDDAALVLDVGGGAHPFARADWVIDLMPYGERGLYGAPSRPADERFSESTWVVRDMCDHDPWPFSDDQFDFVVCAQTLEDVRDPVWVCREMIRVGKAGFIEVPSRLEEQSYGFQGRWTGWSHHRWLIDIEGDQIQFVFKHHVIHGRGRNHFDADFRWALGPERRVQSLWWEGGFRYAERMLGGPGEVDAYLADYVAAHRPPRAPIHHRAWARLRWLLDRPRYALRRDDG